MEAFVTALTTQLSTTTLFGVIAQVAPLIGVSVLVGLGVHFIRRSVNKLSRGKGGI